MCGKHYAVSAATVAVNRPPRESGDRIRAAATQVGLFVLVLGGLWALWEGFKWVGETTGFRLGTFEVNDRTLPHLHDIVSTLFEPSRRNGPLLIDVLLDAALFTAKEAVAGFLLGAAFGFAIAVLLAHSSVLQRGFLPYIVASQTIPILAVAPMVVVWVNPKLPAGFRDWGAVAVIAAFLTFFPVAINTLRGLKSADPRALELMRSYAGSTWSVLWKVRVPASLPYLFAALKVSATGLRRRRDHRRAARLDPGRARGRDPQLQPVLLERADPALGDEHRRGGARHRLLPRDRRSREARRPESAGARRMSEQQAVVRLEDVTKQFGKGGVTALQDVDLEIRPGEFVSLIGPSGCGKSTLLRVVGDLIQPSSGTVEVNGKTAAQARVDRDYGIVFQDSVLFEWRTVAKNIGLPLELAGWSRERRRERVEEMLDLVELTGFESHHPWQLSGGMQQRVSIARALSFSPALLLMDEPFGALDEMTRERLNLELLRIWEASGSTVIFVTHSISEAVFLSTRIVVMSPRPGRITGIVDVDLPQPRLTRTREEPRFAELIRDVRRVLRAGGGFEVDETVDEEQLIVAEEGL